jgi:hypothetical protein
MRPRLPFLLELSATAKGLLLRFHAHHLFRCAGENIFRTKCQDCRIDSQFFPNRECKPEKVVNGWRRFSSLACTGSWAQRNLHAAFEMVRIPSSTIRFNAAQRIRAQQKMEKHLAIPPLLFSKFHEFRCRDRTVIARPIMHRKSVGIKLRTRILNFRFWNIFSSSLKRNFQKISRRKTRFQPYFTAAFRSC